MITVGPVIRVTCPSSMVDGVRAMVGGGRPGGATGVVVPGSVLVGAVVPLVIGHRVTSSVWVLA